MFLCQLHELLQYGTNKLINLRKNAVDTGFPTQSTNIPVTSRINGVRYSHISDGYNLTTFFTVYFHHTPSARTSNATETRNYETEFSLGVTVFKNKGLLFLQH